MNVTVSTKLRDAATHIWLCTDQDASLQSLHPAAASTGSVCLSCTCQTIVASMGVSTWLSYLMLVCNTRRSLPCAVTSRLPVLAACVMFSVCVTWAARWLRPFAGGNLLVLCNESQLCCSAAMEIHMCTQTFAHHHRHVGKLGIKQLKSSEQRQPSLMSV